MTTADIPKIRCVRCTAKTANGPVEPVTMKNGRSAPRPRASTAEPTSSASAGRCDDGLSMGQAKPACHVKTFPVAAALPDTEVPEPQQPVL